MSSPEFKLETAGLIFTVDLLADILYTYYVARVIDKKALQATVASIFLYAVSMYSLYNIVQDPRYFIPAAAGGAVGTYVAIKWEGRKAITEVDSAPDIPTVEPPGAIYIEEEKEINTAKTSTTIFE